MNNDTSRVRTVATLSDHGRQKIEEAENIAMRALLWELREMFGTTSMRSMSEDDRDRLRCVLQTYAEDVLRPVEGHYIEEGLREAKQNTGHLLSAVLAGCITVSPQGGE